MLLRSLRAALWSDHKHMLKYFCLDRGGLSRDDFGDKATFSSVFVRLDGSWLRLDGSWLLAWMDFAKLVLRNADGTVAVLQLLPPQSALKIDNGPVADGRTPHQIERLGCWRVTSSVDAEAPTRYVTSNPCAGGVADGGGGRRGEAPGRQYGEGGGAPGRGHQVFDGGAGQVPPDADEPERETVLGAHVPLATRQRRRERGQGRGGPVHVLHPGGRVSNICAHLG